MSVKNNDYNSSITEQERDFLNNMSSTYDDPNFVSDIYNTVVTQKDFANQLDDPTSAISQLLEKNGGKIVFTTEELKTVFGSLHEKNNDNALVGLQPITITNNNISNDRVAEFRSGNEVVAWIGRDGSFNGTIGGVDSAELSEAVHNTVTIEVLRDALSEYLPAMRVLDPSTGKLNPSIMPEGSDLSDVITHIANNNIHVTANEKNDWNSKYSKPEGGIGESDLSSEVVSKLNPSIPIEVVNNRIGMHLNDEVVHINADDRTKWDGIGDKLDSLLDEEGKIKEELLSNIDLSNLDNHIANNNIHVTANEKNNWNSKYSKPEMGIPKDDLDFDLRHAIDNLPTDAQKAKWESAFVALKGILSDEGKLKSEKLEFDPSLLATKSEIPDVSGLATKSEIPDVSGLATKEELTPLATKTELNNYVLKEELEIPDISDLPTMENVNSAISTATENLATKNEIPDVSGLATKEEVDDHKNNAVVHLSTEQKALLDELAEKDYSVYALKSEIPDISGLPTMENVNSAISTATENLATKSEIPDVSGLASKSEIPDVSGLATTESVNNAISTATENLATKEEVTSAVSTATQGLATTESVNNAVSTATENLATKEEVSQSVSVTTESITSTVNIGRIKEGDVIPAGTTFDEFIKMVLQADMGNVEGEIHSILWNRFDKDYRTDAMLEEDFANGTLKVSDFHSHDIVPTGESDVKITVPEGKSEIYLCPAECLIYKMKDSQWGDSNYITSFCNGDTEDSDEHTVDPRTYNGPLPMVQIAEDTGYLVSQIHINGQLMNCYRYGGRATQEEIELTFSYKPWEGYSNSGN